MPDNPFISIIIPTYNRAHLLPLTLDSFLAQSYPRDRYEIIVADNNSLDDTREVAERYFGNSAVSVQHHFEPRQGVHYARNGAALLARGDILYFTDDDMVADPELLSEIAVIFSQFENVGCATGLILPKFEVKPPLWVEKNLWNGLLSLTARDKPEELIISKNDLVYSCHQAIRRDVFFVSGGFNPENTAGVWIGDGETGLNIKIKALGSHFAYTSKSIIYHVIPKERMTLAYLIRRLSNQANSDSYTTYRTHRQRDKILSLAFKRSTFTAIHECIATLGRILLGFENWRFLPAKMVYFYKRLFYDLKLFSDSHFRRLVEIDDWLNAEQNH